MHEAFDRRSDGSVEVNLFVCSVLRNAEIVGAFGFIFATLYCCKRGRYCAHA
jgi:hypothetical protein